MDKQVAARCQLVTVSHYPSTGLTDYADKEFGTPTSRTCYFENKMNYAHLPDGTRTISQATLFFDGLIPITNYDKFTVNGIDYPVLMIQTFPGLWPNTGTTVVYV